ncbi:MAG: S8 family serine peptidase [Actinomycetota bacterium]
MRIAWGVSWDDSKKGRILVACLGLCVALSVLPAAQSQATGDSFGRMVSVIVQQLPGAGSAPEQTVIAAGGTVDERLGLIDAFEATVPTSAVDVLRSTPGVRAVTPNRPIKLLSSSFDYTPYPGSMPNVAAAVKAKDFWMNGYTGKGVDVALIDTGAAELNGLEGNNVIDGPDLSFEYFNPELRYKDTNGHGTHMAGIIGGKDNEISTVKVESDANFAGIAPDARIVSVKVAGNSGATDVSQVIKAMDWVVRNKNSDGLNIRVLNLSFGTDSDQDWRIDPLSHAAELVWHNGIAVVVAAGNEGDGSAKLNDPAYNPWVIAVGASDTKGTYGTEDDVVPAWSARGDGTRNPDLVAPGKSILSLRNPGSQADNEAPGARVADRFFLGSGTSQAAAVVSGAAALIVQQRPSITPNQLKALLKSSARSLPVADPVSQGSGTLDLKNAYKALTPLLVQQHDYSDGSGSLELSRGGRHVELDGVPLTGELTVFGDQWDGSGWSRSGWSGSGWSGSGWSRSGWSRSGWSGSGWSRSGWSEEEWLRSGWSASDWDGVEWTRSGWSGSGWSRSGWSRSGWSRSGWSGSGWSGSGWSGSGWSGSGWS